MRKELWKIVLLEVAFLLARTPRAQAEAMVEFLIDASGSMESVVAGVPKIAAAKQAVKSVLDSVPAGTKVALRAYAHRIAKENKDQSCLDTELLIPFAPLDKAAFSAKVDSLAPRGWTPIAFSLREAAKDFTSGSDAQYVIILVSDGEETCGGDPLREAKNLIGQGFKVVIHTIGFDVDEKTRAQLQSIAGATGGLYADARDAASLTRNLQQMTSKALLIEREAIAVRGQEIRGGASFDRCASVSFDQEYRLDHHQRKDQYDYFCVDLKKGQELTVTIATLEKGVEIQGDKFKENGQPIVGYRLMNASFEQVGTDEVWAQKSAKESRTYQIPSEGRYYFLFGHAHADMHKDSSFLLHTVSHFDAGSGKDAGDDILQALEIGLGEYPDNWIGAGDENDFYKFSGKAGMPITISAMPVENLSLDLELVLLDPDRLRLDEKNAPNGGAAVRLGPVILARDGTYTFKVHGWTDKPSQYTLSLAGPGGAVASTAMTQPAASAATQPTTLQPAATQPAMVPSPTVPSAAVAGTIPPVPQTMPGAIQPPMPPAPFTPPPSVPPAPAMTPPPAPPTISSADQRAHLREMRKEMEEGPEEEIGSGMPHRGRPLIPKAPKAALAVIFLEALVIVGLVIVIFIMVLKRGGKKG